MRNIIYSLKIKIAIILMITATVSGKSLFAQTKKDLDEHKRKWDTPAWTDTITNHFAHSTAATDSGKVLYNRICVVCHGPGGKGDGVAAAGLTVRPANHTSAIVQSQTDGSLFYELSNGHTPMPAYKSILTEKERWGLINYIRVLGKNTKTGSQKNKILNPYTMKQKLLLLACLLGFASITFAQSENEGPRNFGTNKLLISGHGTFLYSTDTATSSFGDASFSVKFLGKLSERLFIEPEIEIETGEGEASFGLEQMNLVYMVSPKMMIHAGRFLPKFGAYRGRLGEDFINRFPNNPVGFGDGGFAPMVETGIGILGGLPLGSAKMNYDIWIANGPQLITDPGSGGQFETESFSDNNKNKAIGGRLGFLPFSSSSLEIGVSYYMAAKTGNSYDTTYEKVGVDLMAVDLNYFKTISAIKSTIRLIGEWKQQMADDAEYYSYTDTITGEDQNYTYDNKSTAMYGCFLIRPSASENNFIRNLEVGFRYSQFENPKDAIWGGPKSTQNAFTVDYWLKWNSVIKLTYVQLKDRDVKMPDMFMAQFVYGF